MSLEIEAKFKVDGHGAVRARLIELGAGGAGSVLESNHIFDDAGRSLLAQDKGLRVRRSQDVHTGVEHAAMTYKGPREKSELKQREEIEITVNDAGAAAALLKALGFIEVLCFQKRRETWRLNDCLVELDELPHLGRFVEIEGPNIAQIRQTQRMLNLGHLPHVPDSYIGLLMEYCRAHQISVVVQFEFLGPLNGFPPMLYTLGMPTRANKRRDFTQIAKAIVDQTTGQTPPEEPAKPTKNPAAVALGRLGGLKGGKVRAEKLSKKRRQEIAKNAAERRWAKRDR